MVMMTATEVSRNFAGVLDRAERGEAITITRGGKRVAMIGPAPAASGRAVKDLLARHRPDPDWARELEELRELVVDTGSPWPES